MEVWPPHFSIKKNRRARYVKIRVPALNNVELTVPHRFNQRDIPDILLEHKAWIIKQWQKIAARPVATLPHQINLSAISGQWQVRYVACNKKLELLYNASQEIVLMGKIEDQKACQKLLIAWLKMQAKFYLPSILSEVSERLNLPYENVRIRDQKTVWGSCTSKKNISLNYKLLFLPLTLMQHVLIHELCHTKYLNHSEKFWNLVAKCDVNWEENRRVLRGADAFIPGWIGGI